MATAIRIASVARTASTCGQVIGNTAIGIGATGTGTGIAALLLLARLVGGAVRVAYAFGSARLIGVSEVVGQALTRADAVAFSANGIRSTGVRLTGCYLLVHYALCGVVGVEEGGRERESWRTLITMFFSAERV